MSKNNWGWSVKIFILSICLSVVFSTISQSLFPTLPNILSVAVILFFIALSTIFDMIGVAIASTNKEKLKKDQFKDCWQTANKLCDNTEKRGTDDRGELAEYIKETEVFAGLVCRNEFAVERTG